MFGRSPPETAAVLHASIATTKEQINLKRIFSPVTTPAAGSSHAVLLDVPRSASAVQGPRSELKD